MKGADILDAGKNENLNEPENEEEMDNEVEISEPELPPETDIMLEESDSSEEAQEDDEPAEKPRSYGIILSFVATVLSAIYRAIRSSAATAMLTAYDKTADAFRSSWLYGVLFSEGAISMADKLKVRFRRATTHALIPKGLAFSASRLLVIRSKIYGFIMLFFGLTTLLVHYAMNSMYKLFIYDIYAPLTAVSVCAVAIFFVFSNDTLIKCVYNSRILGALVFDLMGVKQSSADAEPYELSASGACIFGIILGSFTFVFPARYIVLLVAAVLYAVIVMKSPEAGMISVMILATFAPFKLLCIAIVLLAVSYLFKVFCGKRTLKLEFIDAMIAVFLLIKVLAETVSFGGKGDTFQTLVFGSAYFITVSILRSEPWFKRAIRAIVIGVSVISVFSVLFYLMSEVAHSGMLANVDFSSFGAFVAQLQLYSFFIILAVFLKEKNKNLRLGLMIVMVLNVIYISLALPNGAIVAGISALAVFLVLYNVKNLALVLAALVVRIVLPIFGVLGPISLSADKGSLIGLNTIIKILSKYGFTGIGASDSALDIIYSSISVGSSSGDLREQSLLLQIALETGYIGAVMFIFTFVLILQSAFSYGRSCPDKTEWYRLITYAGMCGIVAAFVYGIVQNIWIDQRMFLVYWILAGITTAASRCAKAKTNVDNYGLNA